MKNNLLKQFFLCVLILSASNTVFAQYTLTDINHIIGYGQSLSLGSVDTCIVTTSQKYNSLMFSKELRTYDYATGDFSTVTFVPLIEKTWLNRLNYAESPYSGMSEMLIESLNKDGKFNQATNTFFFHAAGKGGTSITGLNKGTATTSTFDYLERGVYRAKALATAQGKNYKVPCFTWIHGEQDLTTFMPPAQYVSLLKNLQQDIETVAKTASGQTEPVPCVLSQTASFNRYHILRNDTYLDSLPNYKISDAVYHLALEQPAKFIFATTMYPFIYGQDNVHLTAESSKLVGAYFGYAIKKAVVDGETMLPVHPVQYTASGNELTVKFFVPVKPLVLDTKQVRFIDNFGFNIYHGVNEIAIQKVELTGEDEIKFTCSQAIQSGDILTYAINAYGNPFSGGYTTGALKGSRGNLRDSRGETVTFTIGRTIHKLHNWCPIFSEKINL